MSWMPDYAAPATDRPTGIVQCATHGLADDPACEPCKHLSVMQELLDEVGPGQTAALKRMGYRVVERQ